MNNRIKMLAIILAAAGCVTAGCIASVDPPNFQAFSQKQVGNYQMKLSAVDLNLPDRCW